MRSKGYGSWVGLSVCLCVSVQHLTFKASVRSENAVTYSAGNEGQKICGDFSETALLQRSSISLSCTASVQCEGTHSLGIRFFWFKKANNRPKATCNTSQCETATYLSLSAALVSVSGLAIFHIRPDTRKNLSTIFRIPQSVTRAFY